MELLICKLANKQICKIKNVNRVHVTGRLEFGEFHIYNWESSIF